MMIKKFKYTLIKDEKYNMLELEILTVHPKNPVVEAPKRPPVCV